jgi:hypothetical protein
VVLHQPSPACSSFLSVLFPFLQMTDRYRPSRIRTGISAPLLTGYLLTLSPSFPLWMSAGTFGLAGLCCLGLPYERASDADGGGKEREEGGLD